LTAQPGGELDAELIEARALGKAASGRRAPFTRSFRHLSSRWKWAGSHHLFGPFSALPAWQGSGFTTWHQETPPVARADRVRRHHERRRRSRVDRHERECGGSPDWRL